MVSSKEAQGGQRAVMPSHDQQNKALRPRARLATVIVVLEQAIMPGVGNCKEKRCQSCKGGTPAAVTHLTAPQESKLAFQPSKSKHGKKGCVHAQIRSLLFRSGP